VLVYWWEILTPTINTGEDGDTAQIREPSSKMERAVRNVHFGLKIE